MLKIGTWPAFWLSLLVVIAPVAGQESLRTFRQLTLKDGLPNPSVLDIRQDRQGLMWFATFSGIARYDGYAMQVYHPRLSGPDTIPLRNLPVLGEGPEGELLVGYAWGDCKLFRYDAALDRLEPYLYDTLTRRSLVPLNDGVSALYTDSRGWLWIGTMGIGVFVVKGEEVVHYPYCPDGGEADCFPTPDVLGKMAEDEAGNIWFPTFEGLGKWEAASGTFRLFPFSDQAVERPNSCFSLYYAGPDRLWVGSTHEGLLRFDTERETFERFPLPVLEDVEEVFINDLAMLPDGRLALSCRVSGDQFFEQLIFDPAEEQWTILKNRGNRLGNDNANFVDYAGSLWMGKWQSGVLQYDTYRERFRRWHPDLLRTGQVVHSRAIELAEDATGTLWIGTEDAGLFTWNPQTGDQRRYTRLGSVNPSLPVQSVIPVPESQPGALWIGADSRVGHFTPATGRWTTQTFSWQGESIREFEIGATSANEYWLYSWSFGGFCRLAESAGRFSVAYCHRAADSDSLWALGAITAMVRDSTGRLWIGNNQRGLYIFDPASRQFELHLPEYGVWSIHFDRQGTAWLNTHSQGLIGYDADRRRVLPLDAETKAAIGLAQGLLEDRRGMLWMINEKGLVQFDPFARRVKRLVSATNWRRMDEPGSRFAAPFLRTRSGAMLFGEYEGVVHFHPDSLLLDTLPPRMAFTDLKLFNESVQPDPDGPLPQHLSRAPEVRLAHWQNDLSVQFAALHFKNPSEYRYRYRLLPGNAEWIDIGNRREVFFTGLAPGHYTLWVQAANADGTWNEEGIRLSITVRRPWWGTYWAFALYGLLFLAGSYLVYRFLLGRRLREAENRRLRELDAFKNRVFTNITHEFRTPLTLILGTVERFRSRLARMFHPDLDLIDQQGNRLLGLVNRMLDLAQLEAGQLRLEPVQSDIHFFLRYVTQAFESLAQDRGLDLRWSIPDEPYVMDFDPTRLEQVVSNLLSNAIKFTPAGGRVQLTASVGDTGRYRIEVSDTGPGIAPELRERVFQRFFRVTDAEAPPSSAEASATAGGIRPGEGTGIGLALCRELVELMGGDLSLASEPGRGARFTVELPVSRRAPQRTLPWPPPPETAFAESIPGEMPVPEPTAAEIAAAERPLVLVVEDHAALRTYLRGCLEDRYQVLEAADGQQGLDLALDRTPDLIVSDVMMPVMDGFALCRRLKADRRTSHIPVVLLTAKVDTPSRLAGRRYGADAYLTKPFLPDELRLIARNQLAHRQRLRAHYQSLLTGETTAAAAADPPEEAAFIAEVRAYVLDHLDATDLNVEALAAALHMSRSQLYRKVKSLSGLTPVMLIREVRLAQAKILLRITELQIAEIAYRCGYGDPNFFTRVFREEVGVTPVAFRNGSA
jgi:signal transduction histidine kinase/CheY-like chemotaxis protein/ligand-binding sensor domain-containing protein